jgi:hypothetical protein
MLFQIGELTGGQLRVAVGAGQHDRAFDDADDVVGELGRFRTRRAALGPRGGSEVWLEFLGHLVEALGESAAEAVVGVAQGSVEVPDDAAAAGVMTVAESGEGPRMSGVLEAGC